MITIDQIRQLREETEVSVSECKKALEEAGGDIEKAKNILKKLGKAMAEKKKSREAGQGIVEAYIHPNKKIGVLIDIRCETDFVAKSPDFRKLAHELCLQIAAVSPDESPLLEQPWIRDADKSVKDLVEEYIAKIGENIEVKRFIRYEI